MHRQVGIGALVLLTEVCSFVRPGYRDQCVVLAVPPPPSCVQGSPVPVYCEAPVDQSWGPQNFWAQKDMINTSYLRLSSFWYF